MRLPLPQDSPWAKDQTTTLKALGVLDPQGNPTRRLELVKTAQVARLTGAEWQKEREEMVAVCSQCHWEKFARGELAKGEDMIRETDRLLAEGLSKP